MKKRGTRTGRLTRKSFFVDPAAIGQARAALGAQTDAEAVRLAIQRVVEMERFWRFMSATRCRLKPESTEQP